MRLLAFRKRLLIDLAVRSISRLVYLIRIVLNQLVEKEITNYLLSS